MLNHVHGGLLKWIELHPGTASWVQAIGSVGAILAAVWIAGFQSRRDAHQRKLQQQAVLTAIAAIAEEAYEHIQDASNEFNRTATGLQHPNKFKYDYLHDVYRAQQFEDLAASFLQITIDKIPNRQLAKASIKMRSTLIEAKSILDEEGSAFQQKRDPKPSAPEYLAHLESDAKAALRILAPASPHLKKDGTPNRLISGKAAQTNASKHPLGHR